MNLLLKIVIFSIFTFHCIAISATPKPVNPGLADKNIQQAISKIESTFSSFIARDAKDIRDKLPEILPNSDMFVYVLDASEAGSLGLTFLSAEAAKKSTIIVQEYTMFRNSSVDGKQARFGIGIRMLVTVNEKSGKVGTLSIPSIAASVENKKMEATVRLQVIGISSKAVTEAVPMPSELNFSTLMQMYKAIDAIKSNIWVNGTYILPQIIAFEK